MELQAPAVGAVVVQLAFLSPRERFDALRRPVRVRRELRRGRAQRDDVQRRIGRVGLDRELGHGLVGRVQHVGAARCGGVGEDSGEVGPAGDVGVVGFATPVLGSAGDREQQRREVDAGGELLADALGGAGEHATGILDEQRDADALLVGAGALAPQPVRAAVLAVIGGEHDHRVLRHLRTALRAFAGRGRCDRPPRAGSSCRDRGIPAICCSLRGP